MTLANRVGQLIVRSSQNGLTPTMLILGLAEQAEMRAEMQASVGMPNVEGYPDAYQGLVIVRVNAPSLLMVGNVTVEA